MITVTVASASSIKAAKAALIETLPEGFELRALRRACKRKANPRIAKPTARYMDQAEPIIPATAATATTISEEMTALPQSSAEEERPRMPFGEVTSLTESYSSAKAPTR